MSGEERSLPSSPRTSVPLPIKLAYGYGSVSEGVKDVAFKTFLLFYYNQVLGLPGWMGGLAGAIALIFDAVTDPVVGSLSDHTRSRFGRRHPYMYASALPMAACFYLLFNPPGGLSENQLFAWLVVFAVLVRGSMTLYSIPSNALVPELSKNYDERTSLVSFRYLFGFLGGGGMSLLAYLVFLAPSDEFPDGLRNAAGYEMWAVAGALQIFAAILLSALGTHGQIPGFRQPVAHGSATALQGFWQEIRDALSNASYRTLVIAALFAAVAGAFSDVFGLFLFDHFWELSTEQVAFFVPGGLLGISLGVVAARPLSARYDKKSVALGLACSAVLLGPVPIFLRLAGLAPANQSGGLLAMLVLHAAVMTTFSVTIGILIGSMLADTIDQQELVTGRRQEGVFSSAIAFSAKAASGVGTLMAGVALDLIAFPRPAAGELAPPPTDAQVAGLGWVVGPGMVALWVCTLVFLSRYRIGREDHRRILAELALRNEAAHPEPDEESREA